MAEDRQDGRECVSPDPAWCFEHCRLGVAYFEVCYVPDLEEGIIFGCIPHGPVMERRLCFATRGSLTVRQRRRVVSKLRRDGARILPEYATTMAAKDKDWIARKFEVCQEQCPLYAEQFIRECNQPPA